MSAREPMRSPVDGARLVEVDRSEILIDACPECRGVWLDRGEIDKILVKERQLAAGAGADDDFFAEVEGTQGQRRPEPGRPSYDAQVHHGHHDSGHHDSGHHDSGHGGNRRGGLGRLLDFD